MQISLSRVIHAARHPDRVWDHLSLKLQKARLSEHREGARLLDFIAGEAGVDGAAIQEEYRTSPFRVEFRERLSALARHSSRERGTTSGFDLSTLYILVRALRPQVVVETGVLYGASSAHILAALRQNGGGDLHSFDLPNPPGYPSQSFLVPEELRARWSLNLGDIRETLPAALEGLGQIDLFHHDSQHTYDHMMFEYRLGWAHLGAGGVLTSHDVIRPWFRKSAPRVFQEQSQARLVRFRNFGVFLRQDSPSSQQRD